MLVERLEEEGSIEEALEEVEEATVVSRGEEATEEVDLTETDTEVVDMEIEVTDLLEEKPSASIVRAQVTLSRTVLNVRKYIIQQRKTLVLETGEEIVEEIKTTEGIEIVNVIVATETMEEIVIVTKVVTEITVGEADQTPVTVETGEDVATTDLTIDSSLRLYVESIICLIIMIHGTKKSKTVKSEQ